MTPLVMSRGDGGVHDGDRLQDEDVQPHASLYTSLPSTHFLPLHLSPPFSPCCRIQLNSLASPPLHPILNLLCILTFCSTAHQVHYNRSLALSLIFFPF